MARKFTIHLKDAREIPLKRMHGCMRCDLMKFDRSAVTRYCSARFHAMTEVYTVPLGSVRLAVAV